MTKKSLVFEGPFECVSSDMEVWGWFVSSLVQWYHTREERT